MRLNFSELPTPTLSRQHSSYGHGHHERHHSRASTHPHLLSTRRKPRRWPLVFRFIKGAIHGAILVQVVLHAIFTAFVVWLDRYVFDTVGLPNSIIPSLSIVVGLMLVFRNQTSYNRFWDGRNGMTTIHTTIRNLVRTILSNAYSTAHPPTPAEKHDIERTVRILTAIPFAVKNHLRAEWGAAFETESGGGSASNFAGLSNGLPGLLGSDLRENGTAVYNPVYAGLLPPDLQGYEGEGLGLPFQLTFFVDGFIKRGVERGWFNAPGASQMQAQLNVLMDAFGKMETIKLTPIPVAHLIHQKQVLALYGCVLPFAMVDDMGWWTIPIVSLVIFTLYGIEGIGSQLEDPFGYDRNDIKMDALVGDARMEIDAVLEEWRRVMVVVERDRERAGQGDEGEKEGGFVMPDMFLRPRISGPGAGHGEL